MAQNYGCKQCCQRDVKHTPMFVDVLLGYAVCPSDADNVIALQRQRPFNIENGFTAHITA